MGLYYPNCMRVSFNPWDLLDPKPETPKPLNPLDAPTHTQSCLEDPLEGRWYFQKGHEPIWGPTSSMLGYIIVHSSIVYSNIF